MHSSARHAPEIRCGEQHESCPKEGKLTLWIIASTLLFLVFIVFFGRQFPRYNWLFASWLLLGILLQTAFAVLAALNLTEHIPDLPLAVVGYILMGLAVLKAHRSQDAVNEVVFSGLLALIFLTGVSMAAVYLYDQDSQTAVLAQNLAFFAPLGYMLVRFTFVYSDRLPLIAGLRDSVFGQRISEALGYARSILM